MNDKATATPLVDMLRSVPRNHRTEWEMQWAEDGTPTGHAMSPIGKHCHDAADRITELEAQLGKVREYLINHKKQDAPEDLHDPCNCFLCMAIEALLKGDK